TTVVSTAAQGLLARTNQHLPVFSKAHWTTHDRIMLSMLYTPGNGQYEIIWTDLEATVATQGTGWDILKRTGETTKFPAAASFSHDGKSVIYANSSNVMGGHQISDGDLMVVPFNNKQGGTPVAVNGASEPGYNEYYPTYSPDDKWIAFARAPNGSISYSN